MPKDGFSKTIKEDELAEGQMKAVQTQGKPVLLGRVNGQIYALSNVCPHAGCHLHSGVLTGYIVMCPCHGWKFDLRTGEYESNPLTKLASYQCKVEDGKILVNTKIT